MGDVIFAYHPWVEAMISGGKWFGLNTPWVYPYPALAPLLLAQLFSGIGFLNGWLVMAIALNEVALILLLWRFRAAPVLGWYWLAATAALGPVALSRLDGISISISLIAIGSLFAGSIYGSSIGLAVASWFKVWPAAILGALFLPKENRIKVFRAALYVSVGFVVVGFLLGGNQNLFSFVLAQNNRGIQLESLAAMPWVWADVQHHGAHIYYDSHILTFQVRGAGSWQTSRSMGWYMLSATSAIFALAWWARIRNAPNPELVSFAALALTLGLILFNKVGSPQYLGWLIIPTLIGMHFKVRSWWPAVVLVLLATGLTQVIYPNIYEALLKAEVWAVALLTLRNALEVLLLGWAIWRLARLGIKKKS
jgi:hypothetical protein